MHNERGELLNGAAPGPRQISLSIIQFQTQTGRLPPIRVIAGARLFARRSAIARALIPFALLICALELEKANYGEPIRWANIGPLGWDANNERRPVASSLK